LGTTASQRPRPTAWSRCPAWPPRCASPGPRRLVTGWRSTARAATTPSTLPSWGRPRCGCLPAAGQGTTGCSAATGAAGSAAGKGDDVMSGGEGADVIFAGRGDNVAFGGAGDDILRGEDGDDFLDGGFGDDILIGNAGDDILLNGEVVFDS